MNNENSKKRGGARLIKNNKTTGKRKRTRIQKYRIAVIIGIIVLALILTAVLVYKSLFVKPNLPNGPGSGDSGNTSLDYGSGIRPKSNGERKSEDFYSILILGRDTGGGGNTDTMLLASYDVTNQKAAVMSIPRDTMVNVSWDVKKINSVYTWYGGGDKGIEKLYQEISQLVGFEPDFQVVIEWEAVGEIVDAIGGVWFDVPYTMDYDDPYQNLHIHQEKGYRCLTGDDAMQVIRWRKNNKGSPHGNTNGVGDIGRMQIQQDFLQAMITDMLKPKNIANLDKLSKVFQENVTTDLSLQNILWFGQQAALGGLSIENVDFFTMPHRAASLYSRSYSKPAGKPVYLSYVVPVADELLTLVNDSLSPFSEPFLLSDLDILSVNSDGSVSSSSGHVEDEKATYPKSYWIAQFEPSAPPSSEPSEAPSDPPVDLPPDASELPEPSPAPSDEPIQDPDTTSTEQPTESPDSSLPPSVPGDTPVDDPGAAETETTINP